MIKKICSLRNFTPPFQQQTCNAVHYTMQPSFSNQDLLFVSLRVDSDKAHMIFLQTTVFVRIFLQICRDDNKCMNDYDKRMTTIVNYAILYLIRSLATTDCKLLSSQLLYYSKVFGGLQPTQPPGSCVPTYAVAYTLMVIIDFEVVSHYIIKLLNHL